MANECQLKRQYTPGDGSELLGVSVDLLNLLVGVVLPRQQGVGYHEDLHTATEKSLALRPLNRIEGRRGESHG